jgi:hypothetical protein
MEMQRLLAPVMASKWTVLRAVGTIPLITNDVGYGYFGLANTGEYGMFIPLRKDFLLGVIPDRKRPIVIARNGEWYPLIDYADLAPSDSAGFNRTLVQGAGRFVFGPDAVTIKQILEQFPK